ncbi:DUF998 domain-containing protein [Nocardia bhagyanarayanae]|uniref:Uncharacterized protein DUF998 n=1 Tax=Nocardia bhagyanarayanae TaxID=1215925 RepID=A0A543F845_9NOCA|nr:DUF998 domain-containing protein [Nocardia bhagyanarayanae]TQM29981.1 uncharacterized protein DUF998 [Nocardia bhagyanarayanae]
MKTEKLLAAGILATPMFFVVALAQAFTKDGFDLREHMISQLALGPLGWIQIANFLVTGALFALVAVGLRRGLTTGIGRTWISRLVGVFAAGMIGAGVFVCDPYQGYPAGAAEAMTWHGTLHGVSAAVAGLALVAVLVIMARRFRAEQRTGAAVLSIVIAVVYVVLPASIPALTSITFPIASLLAWGWVAVFAAESRSELVVRPAVSAGQLQPA